MSIYVSSTFEDCHAEREAFHYYIVPKLKAWYVRVVALGHVSHSRLNAGYVVVRANYGA